MSLRTRLIVAFFAVSVLPLGAVTTFSYLGNVEALRAAAAREADLLAGELGQRMQLVTAQLSERVEHLMDLSELQAEMERLEEERIALAAQAEAGTVASAATPMAAVPTTTSADALIASSLGDAAMLLNHVELRGIRRRPRSEGPGGPPRPAPLPRTTAPTPQVPQPPSGPDPDRLMIDLGPMRDMLMKELVPSGNLAGLSPEERSRVGRELNARLMGVVEGIKLGGEELQKRADAAKNQAQATAKPDVPATAPAPPPLPRPAPPPSARPAASADSAATRPPAPAGPPVVRVSAPRRMSLAGSTLGITRERDGRVQQVSAEINLPNVLAAVFSTTRGERGEVPFAFSADGALHTPTEANREAILALGPIQSLGAARSSRIGDWIVVTTEDPSGTGLRMGIARPVGDSVADLRRATIQSAALGLGFFAVALVGIVPLSMRLTRNLSVLTDGVSRLARGDYSARVPVRSDDEVGRLGKAFNQMAADVERHQRSAVEQERIKRELELGRQIQNEMLPHSALRMGLTEITGVSVPAREVGGDFFNYFEVAGGCLALLVGDVSGKGVGAALLMANLQASLRTRLTMGQDLAAIADAIDRDVEANSPGPVYATLFVGVLDPATRVLRYVNAGHHPQFLVRAGGGALESMSSTGLPIGLLAGRGFQEQRVQLAPRDVLFFYTDGCVEAESETGDMFGAERLEQALIHASEAGGTDAVLEAVERVILDFRGTREAFDDATMMALRVG